MLPDGRHFGFLRSTDIKYLLIVLSTNFETKPTIKLKNKNLIFNRIKDGMGSWPR